MLKDDDPLFPMQAFFNIIRASEFIEIVSNLTSGHGAGLECVYCGFPGDADPGEEPFEGVRFALFEDEVVVDEKTFAKFLRLACEAK